MGYAFEQGPIRPPSEARSLLVRLTRNCPWNKCEFCSTYKETKFERRSVEEVKDDILKAKEICDDIKALSWRYGQAGAVNQKVINLIFQNPGLYGDSHRSLGVWMYFGAENAFLQDANSLIMKTRDLVDILKFLKSTFPTIKRITSYARSKTIARKDVEDLKALFEAGLSRLHFGMETGYDKLLDYVKKGVTAEEHIDAGKKVKASGISLSEYVILGLGGRQMWREHAIETATVLNQIDPDFIRFRTLTVQPSMPLYEKLKKGEFTLQSEEEIVREERLLIENLDGITSILVSDHILNLLEEVEGQMPEDKEKILAVIDRYLALNDRDKLIYAFGRRAQAYRSTADLSNMELYRKVEAALDRFLEEHEEDLDGSFNLIRREFI
jgi:radical SAM superfamily enzyme YgiQ (UPF0313 family)